MKTTENLFSYGTLKYEKVQLATFVCGSINVSRSLKQQNFGMLATEQPAFDLNPSARKNC
jgi:hypothetical protein